MDHDVLVIGAGIAGASLAAHLARVCNVVVLEGEPRPGYHSTGRSAALFSEIYGGRLVRALSRASRDFFYSPPPEFDRPLVRRRGSLFVAGEGQQQRLQSFAGLPDVQPAIIRVGAVEALKLCPILRSDLIKDAVFEPASADIDVHTLHQGYIRDLRRCGGSLLTDHMVETLCRSHGKWVAVANGEQFTAPIVVNAAGAWADRVAELAGVAPIGVTPKRRTALLVAPPAGFAVDTWPIVIDTDEQFYFKPDAGQLLLSPADETPTEPCDAQPDEWDIAVAIDRIETITTLECRHVKHRWAGLRSFVADREPVAGFDAKVPGFFWLAGQGGYGIQTAPALSRCAASIILSGSLPDDVAAFGVDVLELGPTRLGTVHVQ
jgi:D-arginine dehydrogenase